MKQRLDVARGRDIVARWHALAEQRLEHLTELFETGRWRRFHTERAFLENIREAKAAVETWRDLLTREASKNNSVIDVSWLGLSRTDMPHGEMLSERVRRLPMQSSPLPLMIEIAPTSVSEDLLAEVLASTVSISEIKNLEDSISSASGFEEASSLEAPVPEDMPALTPSMVSVHERYPLLHNAL
jgi:uncharacterized repeat protein (TIGR03809 family)